MEKKFESDLYCQLVSMQGEGIGLVDTNEVFIYANAAAERIFGVGPGELIGRKVTDFLDEENLKRVQEATARRLQGIQESYLLEINAADGVRRVIQLTATPQKDASGKVTGTYGVFRDVTEEVKLQRELLRSETTLRAIIESTADGILVVGNDRKTIIFNQKFIHMWKIPTSIWQTHDDHKMLEYVLSQLEEPDAFITLVEELYKSEKESFDEIRFKDGRIFERYSKPLIINKEIMGRVWSFSDVTAQRKAQQDLQKSELTLRATIDSTADGILVVSKERKFLFYNQKFQKIWRIPQEILDTLDSRIISSYVLHQLIDPQGFKNKLEELYNSDKEDFEIIHFKDGRVIERYSKPLIVNGQMQGRVWSFRDVTLQRLAEESIKSEAAKLSGMIAAMLQGVVFIGVGGEILDANEAFKKLANIENKKLHGETIFLFLDQELRKKLQDFLLEASKNPAVAPLTLSWSLWNRELIINASAIRHQEKLLGVMINFYDVTELVRARREAQQALLMKNNFIATVSHEIRTPLTGMLGMIDLALQTSLSKEQREYLEAARSSATVLRRLLDDLLDFSKLETTQIEIKHEQFDPRRRLETCLEMHRIQARQKGLNFLLNIQNVPATLIGDADRLCQVAENLVANALRFTQEGHIEVSVDCQQIPNQTGRVELLLQVKDTGAGIESQHLSLIFEPFVQAGKSEQRSGGIGLGLSIAKRLVEAMGGKITVASQPGKGSTFEVRIPLETVESSVTSRQSIELEPLLKQLGGERALVKELLSVFKNQLQKDMQLIENAITKNRLEDINGPLSRLDGAASSLNSTVLMDLAKRCKSAFSASDLELLKKLISTELKRLLEEIDESISKLSEK